jgi:hypothetical protein
VNYIVGWSPPPAFGIATIENLTKKSVNAKCKMQKTAIFALFSKELLVYGGYCREKLIAITGIWLKA